MIKSLLMASMLAATVCAQAKDIGTGTGDVTNTIIINFNQGQIMETSSDLSAQQTTEQEKPKEQGHSKTFFATIIVGTIGIVTRVGWEAIKIAIDSSGALL